MDSDMSWVGGRVIDSNVPLVVGAIYVDRYFAEVYTYKWFLDTPLVL